MPSFGPGRHERPDDAPVPSDDPNFGILTIQIPPVGQIPPAGTTPLQSEDPDGPAIPQAEARERPETATPDPQPTQQDDLSADSLGQNFTGRDRSEPPAEPGTAGQNLDEREGRGPTPRDPLGPRPDLLGQGNDNPPSDGRGPGGAGGRSGRGGRGHHHGPGQDDPVVVAEARPVDGAGSNETYLDWGATGQTLLRLAEADFDDGIGTLAEADRPNPREISNAVAEQEGDEPSSFGISDLFWVWGQFIDHDIDLTEAGETEYEPIAVPLGDPAFDPDGEGGAFIPFFRVDPVEGSGETTPREYPNEITSYLDASMVYGSDEETAAALRGADGTLLLDESGFLVETEDGVLAGDVRAAENVALTSLHTLFAREHNWWVEKLAARDPELTDDELYQAARQRVEATIQAVTFNEFLPILLGEEAIEPYEGYDPEVNPGISVEFSTAAYRFGHSLLSAYIVRLEENGETIDAGNLALRDAFFSPDEITENGGIAPLLRGLAGSTAQELDTQVVEDVRSFLFGDPGDGGLDLAAINIQRGRDLGVASYNDLREALGLERAESFADVTSDVALAQALEDLYGDVDLLDAWVGGLAEDPHADGLLGELFYTVVLDQFLRIRDGDPFWSEGSELPQGELDKLWSTSLADIIERNGDVETVQDQVFYAYERQGGSEGDDVLEGGEERDLLIGLEGDDSLSGGAGEDQLEGDAGGDHLEGGAGDDLLRGGKGADILIGGAGDDELSGDQGPDRFVFNLSEDSGNDVILDFGAGDVLVLAELLADFDSLAELDSLLGQAEGFGVSQSGGNNSDVTVTFGQGGGSATLVGIGEGDPIDSFQELNQSILLDLQGA